MPFWSRLRRALGKKEAAAAPTVANDAEPNILVVSDIHLGEDIIDGGPEHLGEYIRALNHELSDLIRGHTGRRRQGRPWHLVFNGDGFDFVKATLNTEADPEAAALAWQRRESHETVPTGTSTAGTVLRKLEAILDIHRPVFTALAEFLAAGHRVTFVHGNHDAELYFPEVRARLREWLVAAAMPEGADSESRARLAARIEVRSWFFAIPGQLHIEHGSQYDPYCSIQYNLTPLDHQGMSVATPMSHRVMPYFARLLGDFTTDGIDRWSLFDWLRYVFALGPRLILTLAQVYARAMWELLSEAGEQRRQRVAAFAERHRDSLRGLAAEGPYGHAVIVALDAIKATPVEFSFWRMVRVFYLDRLVLGASTLIAVGVGVATLSVAGLWFAASFFLASLIVRALLSRGRRVDLPDQLRHSAARIAHLTGARWVIFGHSHHPELVPLSSYGVSHLGGGSYYVNSGSWVSREVKRQAPRVMTYVELTPEGGRLLRWRDQTHDPEVLAEAGATVNAPPAERGDDTSAPSASHVG